MASVSLTRNVWNPYRVLALDLDLNGPNSSCVGTAISAGRRCRWSFNSGQFSTRQIEAANNQLTSMSRMHPSEITQAELHALARNTLCRDFHQRQAGKVVSDWRARIEYYVSEHGELFDVVAAVRQLQSDVRRERNASRQEIEETRWALNASQNCCSELTDRAKRSEEEAEDLRQQLAASSREIAVLQEAKAKFEEKGSLNEREAESMRQGLQESKVRHEASEAKSSEDSKRLGEQIEALEQKYTEIKDENTAQTLPLQEQDRKIERLVKQVDVVQQELTKRDRHFEQLARHMDIMKQDSAERDRHVGQLVKQIEMATQDSVERGREVEQLMKQMKVLKQELTEREEYLSSLQPQKRGLFTKISRQPPRVLVRKISKMMTTEPAPYVQSAA